MLDPVEITRRLDEWLKRSPQAVGDDFWKMRSGKTELTEAAVLVPIVHREPELTVLLTQRTSHLNDHAGQVSFPGGRVEENDPSPEETALRETLEEIGLQRRHVSVLGRLPEYITGTGFRVIPIVGWVEPHFELSLDTFEVAEAFEVPLRFLLDPANHQKKRLLWEGREREFYVMPYERHYIWGATAGMLRVLYQALKDGR